MLVGKAPAGCGRSAADLEELERTIALESSAIATDYAPLLRRCSKERSLDAGRRLHERIRVQRLDRDTFLGNLLVQMYGRCGRLEEARSVFDGILGKNLFSWSIMIAAYAQNGHPEQALAIYREMIRGPRRFPRIESITYVSALSACSALGDLDTGRSIHRRVVASGMAIDVYLATALINMYGKCGCLIEARALFDRVALKDIVVWNAMIAAYAQNGQAQRALELFREIPRDLQPNELTLVSALDACSDAGDLREGRRIHALVESLDLRLGGSMGNALVNLYGKCGRVIEARSVFDALRPRTVVSWTTMISAYAQNGHHDRALELFAGMDLAPNSVTFVMVLQACEGSVDRLRELHEMAESRGLAADLCVANTLIDMYGKCRDLDRARAVFDAIELKNAVSWNAMITAYAHNGLSRSAICRFHAMDLEGIKPNEVTFVAVLGACSQASGQNIRTRNNLPPWNLLRGIELHRRIVASGLQSDVVVATAVVTMYGRCGRLDAARRAFAEMGDMRNAVSWNALMNACVENGAHRSALDLLDAMIDSARLEPDALTFVAALEACSSLGDAVAGKAVHDRILAFGLESETLVGNALITMYGRCGNLADARGVLESTPSSRNVVSWNAMTAAYAQSGRHKEALHLYWKMLLEGVKPEEATFLSVLEACCCVRDAESQHPGGSHAGKTIHTHIRLAGLESSLLESALVNMYGKIGSLDAAMAVFTSMRSRDSITWTSMISSYAQHGHSYLALSLFSTMQQEGIIADAITLACVVSACSHSGDVKLGWDYFVSCVRDFGESPGFEHYVVMADMLSRAGRLDEAEDLLRNMPFQPDLVSWRTLLSACSNHSNHRIGKRAADAVLELSPGDPAALVLLSNVFSVDEGEKLATLDSNG